MEYAFASVVDGFGITELRLLLMFVKLDGQCLNSFVPLLHIMRNSFSRCHPGMRLDLVCSITSTFVVAFLISPRHLSSGVASSDCGSDFAVFATTTPTANGCDLREGGFGTNPNRSLSRLIWILQPAICSLYNWNTFPRLDAL